MQGAVQSMRVNEQRICQGGAPKLLGETEHNRAVITGGERNKKEVETLLALGENTKILILAGGPADHFCGLFSHHLPPTSWHPNTLAFSLFLHEARASPMLFPLCETPTLFFPPVLQVLTSLPQECHTGQVRFPGSVPSSFLMVLSLYLYDHLGNHPFP